MKPALLHSLYTLGMSCQPLKKDRTSEKLASGAKAHSLFSASCGTTKLAAEKIGFSGESEDDFPSGAKARIDFAGFMYGLKPVPFTESSFSAACKVVPFQRPTGFYGSLLPA
ncbi:MAG: hypothetical protein ABR906_13900 [Terracidiphilus sp.]